ncbi:unnamed protein product, partial [Staurois parvus]
MPGSPMSCQSATGSNTLCHLTLLAVCLFQIHNQKVPKPKTCQAA